MAESFGREDRERASGKRMPSDYRLLCGEAYKKVEHKFN
jgi:hypothetical protein